MGKPIEYNYILKYRTKATLKEPLHVGSYMGDKNEVLIHPVTGIPFIQASSIAGAMRSYCDESFPDKTEYIFGSLKMEEDYSGSRIRITDGVIENAENVKMEYRPRVKISGKTGTVSNSKVTSTDNDAGHKFEMLFVGKSQKLAFESYIYITKDRAQNIKDIMLSIFSAINSNRIQLGGQKSNGCGYLEINKLILDEYDLSDSKSRELWLDDKNAEGGLSENITGKLINLSGTEYVFTVEGETEGELQVKGVSVSEFGQDAPDSVNIQNVVKEYIVPGSSVKGVVRNQMEKIVRYLKLDEKEILDNIFGSTGKGKEAGKAGNISFLDVVVGDIESNDNAAVRNHIHIDKFTGGVINGGKFTEKNIHGKCVIKILIKDKNNPKKAAGLLMLALRDLAVGAISLGGGAANGKGYISVDKITAAYADRKAEIYPNKKIIKDDTGLIKEWLKELQGGR